MTRRSLIGAALCIVPSAWGAEFWNKKQPAEWTDEEVLLLTGNSPWAHETRLDLKAKGGAVDNGIAAVRDPTTGAFRGGSEEGAGHAAKAPSVIVTWQSAQPIFDATKLRLPADFIDHYVIGVKDLPILVDAGTQRQTADQLVDWLKNSATLRARSSEPVQAGVVSTSARGSVVLFGFLRELLPLTAKDKEVTFALDTNQLALKTKFDLKEMTYRGKLAL
jgi:hypothetical protein